MYVEDFYMALAYYARLGKAPQALCLLVQLYDPVLTRKLDTGEDIPMASSSESKHDCTNIHFSQLK